MRILIIFSVALLVFAHSVRAQETAVPYTLADRERSIRMEQRLDDLDKRMEALENRMDRIENRMDRSEVSIGTQFQTLCIVFFTGIVALVGFILWDRRTMVEAGRGRPALTFGASKFSYIVP